MSSLSVFRRAPNGQVTRWNPSELGVEFAAPTPETHKAQVRAIFDVETDAQTGKKRAGLHPAASGHRFDAWQPAEMDACPATVHKAEWAFIETDGAPSLPRFEFDELETPPAPEKPDPEQAVASILEQARHQAEEIILAAQAQADEVLLQAQDEIEAQKKAGYTEGWEQGCRDIEATLQATHKLTEAVQVWKTELLSQGENLLVEMLKEIAEKMFGEGVELDTNALQINLNRMMENARGLGNLNIFLNPRDVKVLDPSWSEYQMLVSGDRVKIIPSNKIVRGGCFVKGDMGIVDGRVETQLEAILKTFDETRETTE